MPNNFVRVGNLDEDAVVDLVKGKVRVENILTGIGIPTDPPPVPEKAWLYADTTDDLAVIGYIWESVSEAWMPVASLAPTTHDVTLVVGGPGDLVEVGDGAMFYVVPPELDGLNVVEVQAAVPGAVSTTGNIVIQLVRLRSGAAADVLSTAVTIEEGARSSYTAASQSVVNTTNDDMATGDFLRVDVDSPGDAASGLQLVVSFASA